MVRKWRAAWGKALAEDEPSNDLSIPAIGVVPSQKTESKENRAQENDQDSEDGSG